jgi:release factor glutamine methyltransferase
MNETVAAALRRGAARLAAAGIDAPRREARLLLHHALGLDRRAMLNAMALLDPARFDALLERRTAREPMAFILGSQGFWTLDLAVSPATLIPRADSETLIAAALAALPERDRVRRILDLGTGTGALLLAALTEFPAAWGIGVDVSPDAAALAARNARANGLADRALLLCGVWAGAIAGQFDLVLANPPYIPSDEIAGLMPEVAAHEPRAALDGGPDGLDAYRAIIAALPRLLAPGGVAVLELGQGQAAVVAKLGRASGFGPPALRHDLGGIARAMVLQMAGV